MKEHFRQFSRVRPPRSQKKSACIGKTLSRSIKYIYKRNSWRTEFGGKGTARPFAVRDIQSGKRLSLPGCSGFFQGKGNLGEKNGPANRRSNSEKEQSGAPGSSIWKRGERAVGGEKGKLQKASSLIPEED